MNEVWQGARHGAEGRVGLVDHAGEASLETALALGKIAPVAGDIAGREFRDLGFHRLVVTIDVELRPSSKRTV
jgi:hypothetical protein